MRSCKKLLSLMLAVTALTGLGTIDVFAKTKINSVSIKVEADIAPDTEFGQEDIEVTVKTGKCEFVEYEILNDDNEWSLNMVPQILVVIEAEDDYYFPSTLTASKIKVSGGTYVSATRAQSSTQLKVIMNLPSLLTYVGEMSEITLDQNGVANWQPVTGAAQYSARLYRDGSGVGTSVTTGNTSYDFSPAMLRKGSYQIRVRAINGTDTENRSETRDSNTINIADAAAAANKEKNTGKAGEWRQDETGWWYCHGDGSYTTSGWEKIHGAWFAFNDAGYRRTGWAELDGATYYFNPENGAMVTNTTIDNKTLGEDGAMIR